MMKKFIIIFFIFSIFGILYSENITYINYDGFTIRKTLYNGMEYLSLEDLKSPFYLKVKYFPYSKIISVDKSGIKFKFVVDTENVFINGIIKKLPDSVKIFDGNIYLPMDFVKEFWFEKNHLSKENNLKQTSVNKSNLINNQINELSFEEKNTIEKNDNDIINKEIVVIIDAGHGGKDPGTVYKKTYEKNITLSIAKKLNLLLKKNLKYKIFMVRNNDKFIDLKERTFFSNSNHGDVFISIHVNASYSDKSTGMEVFVPAKNQKDVGKVYGKTKVSKRVIKKNIESELSDLKQDIIYYESINLAKAIKNAYVDMDVKLPFRGIKKARFQVFKNIDMPCILVETGFISNEYDRNYITNNNNQEKIAKLIYSGIVNYYGKN